MAPNAFFSKFIYRNKLNDAVVVYPFDTCSVQKVPITTRFGPFDTCYVQKNTHQNAVCFDTSRFEHEDFIFTTLRVGTWFMALSALESYLARYK